MAKRTTTTTTVVTNTVASAAQRMAARVTARTGQVTAQKAVRPVLQAVKLVRTGGNAANGLLAVGGASLVVNQRLSHQEGATAADLLTAVAACPRVSNAVGKVSDHAQNCIAYATPARLAAAGIWQALQAAGLVADGQTVPALTIDGRPALSMTRKQLSALPAPAVLASPLLAAIAALTTGKPVPAWVKATLPGADKATAKVTKKASKATA